MTAPAYTTAFADPDPDPVPEPHAERPARDGEFCDSCPRRAFVIYLLPGGARVGWCGWPENGSRS